MHIIIYLIILIPLCGFAASLFVPKQNEVAIAKTAFCTVSIQLLFVLVLLIAWLCSGLKTVNVDNALIVLKNVRDTFVLEFIFDTATATFLIVGGIISTMIILYSRAYLHREKDYKRFYNTILLFYSGYVLTIMSANLESESHVPSTQLAVPKGLI